MNDIRVVVTGIGAVTPLGNSAQATWKNAVEGFSGAAPITKFNPEKFKTHFACEVKDFDPKSCLDRNEIKRSDLFTQYALYAAHEAFGDSGLDMDRQSPFDVGVIWGTGQGGMGTFEDEMKSYFESDYTPRFSPFFVPRMIPNMASGMISMKFGLMGVNYTTISACASSNTAIMDAFNYIRMGKAKAFIAGGSEAPVTEATIGGFTAMKAMSTRNDSPATASRPFDPERDGFVMGEGSCALVLEEYEHAKARGATIYAEVSGAAMTADAYHLTATHPEGIGALRGMKLALQEAGLAPGDISAINTHSTSTPVGDISEMIAVANLYKESSKQPVVTASKSMTGHLLGAAGAMEALLSIMSVKEDVLTPTINTQTVDPEIPDEIDIVLGEARQTKVNAMMSNNFGFGGHNAVVVFRKV
ncbi:beta-ketoacyl-ACP synthase II [Rhodohalobacter mucosus]|uniref:3-oxoacyl-[acyl-carrier-protein] synthase 2 n=1 Tax=Rhodohalobacter mucosus TaxID=2079485 RepID=A0A316TML1_9BACT|nr:beta-ketoacyl-ACP synthase II [Rhodohalobacter mucosus]PWN05660.1 beta-ketoacyl-[acyl-carrier-protein] synthase II [Rhodohalobacter mucosus]